MIVISRTVDVSRPIQTETLHGNEFRLEANAHTFRISVTDGGEPVALTGAVDASMLLADGSGLTLGGSLDDGVAVLTLPQAAYGVPGRFMLAIYSVQVGETEAETVKTCIYACVGSIVNTYGDQQYDPGNLIPDAATLAQYIDDCQTATTAANAAAAAATTAIAGAVRFDQAQTPTVAQQRTARTNVNAADAGVTGQVINPLVYWTDDGSVNLSGQTLTRIGGDVYTFNSPSATGDVYFRIGGTLGATSQANNAAAWSAEIALLEGVPYTLTVTPISGTITGSTNAYVRVFVEGSGVAAADALAQVNTRGGSVTFIWPDGTKKARFISRNVQGFVASNYTFRMTLTVGTPIDNAITIAGATPTITGIAGCRYICSASAVTELAFTPPENGLCAVRFKSGTTATVLTLPNTVKMPDWWTGPEASRTYEINFEDGYGVVTSWA